MRDHRVAGVGLVLDQHFPVAVVHVTQHAAGNFELPDRRAVDHVVEARQAVAEEFLEPEPRIVEFGKHETAVIVHMPHRGQALAGVALLEAGILIALAQRDREQRPVGLEAPRVIRTAKELAGVAAGLRGDARALVRAAVVQHLHAAVGVAHHQHRLEADSGAEIVARVRHLAVVADIDPGVAEHMFHFEREHLLIDIDVAMHLGLAHEGLYGLDISPVFGHHCLLHIAHHDLESVSYKSSTRRALLARDTQICITLPAAFSASDRM